jgi:hypothetical protein
MTDFWGNTAIDFGESDELWEKYPDKVLVTVCNKPFGKSYVLFVGGEDESDEAKQFLSKFHSSMATKGITEYGAGVTVGAAIRARRLESFEGGALF